ncbi:MAG TPA: AmmeMemoRadiSam system radical SAM enzyme [Syntrophorhabdaceae bacterium]|nr:AmmeMemoRadiSam system radical SAM enzyme [Syntrophorhabdaceae bacterium]HOL04780.1 AmmeMemoRadiSam system radical SAM enzyme [Syntrophorhabdaceae bacterium]HON85609.1 AmmeMemoRadiSam system radical SAM enzyme [Syntrophorhabdaceae bacterium]HOT43022.1 AmmeMemoRadiSam system radical SAM enzyme [Syntrophorhabdaceae bacterium]HPC65879.1 AmmeMemoRadiSam system radical SAM enzyme [Syntrophorhabdaceae bacterium]
MKPASFYEKLEDNRVRCRLCRHNCIIAEGKRGFCSVRENRDGILYSLVYGYPCSYHVDPIEKKPLFHFFPGSKAFSIATVGCNFRCLHCQNYEISQMPQEEKRIVGERILPEDVVDMAEKSGCRSISYTYTEPTVFYEYAFDIAKLAKTRGIYNNFVTNGYIEEEPLKAIRPYLDGANIDLKGFDKDFYKRQCKAELQGVIDTIKLYKSLGIWIEITTLIIPGYNDGEDELKAIARFIKDETGVETPWHVSAFYPTYKCLDAKRTPAKTLKRARGIGMETGLRYVYEGNIPGSDGENTYCYNCKRPIIKRFGYTILEYNLKEGACIFCNTKIDGIGL